MGNDQDESGEKVSMAAAGEATPRAPAERANDLDGKEWLKRSISIWRVPREGDHKARTSGHAAPFPEALATRCIEALVPGRNARIGDPFCGSGSTLAAAIALGHTGVGIEKYRHWVDRSWERLGLLGQDCSIIHGDARSAGKEGAIADGSLDLVVTSPPYWNVLARKRTADGREARTYGRIRGIWATSRGTKTTWRRWAR